MRVIDITGPIFDGIWNYGGESKPFNFGKVKMEYGGVEYGMDSLENMLATTGTYFESAGDVHDYTIEDIPIEKLFMIDSYVLDMPYEDLKEEDNRPAISLEDIKKSDIPDIPEKSGIILSTGYGKNWKEPDYVSKCPFLKKEAMDYLIDKKPFIVVFDTPAAENDKNPEGAFDRYFAENILTVTACINLEKIKKANVKLVVMPLRLTKVAMASPCRAVVVED